jgi:GntR family transcriptional regulator
MRRTRLADQAAGELRKQLFVRWPAGCQLPSEKELADELQVSRNTVREALSLLWTEGLVQRRWGVGTFVRDEREMASINVTETAAMREIFRAAGHEPSLAFIDIRRGLIDPETQALFRMRSHQETWQVQRVFAIDGQPAVLLVDYIDAVINGQPVDPMPLRETEISLQDMLRTQVGCRLDHTESVLVAVSAPSWVGELLDIATGMPLIRHLQTTYDSDGQAITRCDSYHRTDTVSLRLIRDWTEPQA